MRFEDFARLHGLIISDVIPFKWVSTPTEDKPRSTNGRYKYMGDVGWVQNWATMDKPSMWKSEERFTPTPDFIRKKNSALNDRQQLAEKASAKAGWIMHQTANATHEYLADKGFPDEEGNVWRTDTDELLVIPMRIDKKLIGCQLITARGEKKFLYGQQTKGASFCIDAKGTPIFCEGYATGLSIRSVMMSNKLRYSIYVCFSAGNLKEVAKQFKDGFVVADNDPSGVGESTAIATGKPYWISDTVGEDFNDYHLRVGQFKASQSLKQLFLRKQESSTLKT
jgi:putative DNA primase/helicase